MVNKVGDQPVKDIYAILFVFIVESCNHPLAQVRSPGYPLRFQTRGPAGATPLIYAYDHDSQRIRRVLYQLCDELLHAYVVKHTVGMLLEMASPFPPSPYNC